MVSPLDRFINKDLTDPEHFSTFKNKYIVPIVSEYIFNMEFNSEICDP